MCRLHSLVWAPWCMHAPHTAYKAHSYIRHTATIWTDTYSSEKPMEMTTGHHGATADTQSTY